MGLASLALQRVLLLLVVAVRVLAGSLSGMGNVLVDMFEVCIDARLVHGQERLDRQADVLHERIAAGARKVFADNDCTAKVSNLSTSVHSGEHISHELEFLRVWSHGVGGHDPTTLTELVSNSKLVKVVIVLWVKAEGNKGKTISTSLT